MHIILELSVNELLTDLYTVNLWASFPPVLIHWWSFLNLAPKENFGTAENSRIRLIDRCARSTKNIYVGNNYTCNMIRQLSKSSYRACASAHLSLLDGRYSDESTRSFSTSLNFHHLRLSPSNSQPDAPESRPNRLCEHILLAVFR